MENNVSKHLETTNILDEHGEASWQLYDLPAQHYSVYLIFTADSHSLHQWHHLNTKFGCLNMPRKHFAYSVADATTVELFKLYVNHKTTT